MKVIKLQIKNFRGIRSLEIDFHDRMNVFIGENGSGKSAILDLLAIMLSRLVGRIRSEAGTGRSYSEWDITNGESETDNEIAIDLNGEHVSWRFTKALLGRRRTVPSNFDQIKPVAGRFQDGFRQNRSQSLPLCIHYDVNRAVLDIPKRIRTEHGFKDQLAAYDEALTAGTSNFRLFFEWFRNRQAIENEADRKKRAIGSTLPIFPQADEKALPEVPDPELEAVRKAVVRMIRGFSDLRVQFKPKQVMLISKDGEDLVVNQLSDGEKCTLAMVGDLARRLAIANPSLKNPLEGHGVVMIDEIDLHLHPAWQRMIIPGLLRAFPNCQFILTTHSPQVLSHIRDTESVFVLKTTDGETTARHPSTIYGLDSNRILEDTMEVPDRPEDIRSRMRDLFAAIDEGNLRKAQEFLDGLWETIGSHPELTKAQVLIRRKEVLGR